MKIGTTGDGPVFHRFQQIGDRSPGAVIAVVAYPSLSDEDAAWVQRVRAAHDSQFDRLPAHFTVVFPADAIVETAIPEVLETAGHTPDCVCPARNTRGQRRLWSGRACVPGARRSQRRHHGTARLVVRDRGFQTTPPDGHSVRGACHGRSFAGLGSLRIHRARSCKDVRSDPRHTRPIGCACDQPR